MRREGQALTGSMGIDKGGARKKIMNYEVRIAKWLAVNGWRLLVGKGKG